MQEQQVVKNLGEAISVLMQAADQGRKAGIYDWEDLELVGQAMKFINILNSEQKKQTETKVDKEMSKPEKETKEVVLDSSKED